MHTHLHFLHPDWHPWLSRSEPECILTVRVQQKSKSSFKSLFRMKTYLTALCISTTCGIMKGCAACTYQMKQQLRTIKDIKAPIGAMGV